VLTYSIWRGILLVDDILSMAVVAMIGLEYISKVFRVEYKVIAVKIGVSQPTIQDWLKDRRRIPKQRLEALSALFRLEGELFQKELTELEKLNIELDYIRRRSRKDAYDIEYESTDDDGKHILIKESINPHEDEWKLKQNEIELETMIQRLKGIIDPVYEKSPLPFESNRNIETLKRLLDIWEDIDCPDTLSEKAREVWDEQTNRRLEAIRSTMYFLGPYKLDWEPWMLQEGSLESDLFHVFSKHQSIRSENLNWYEPERSDAN